MMLYMTRNEGETPLQAALRHAEPYGLEKEVTDAYHAGVTQGLTPENAAFYALSEWDLLEYDAGGVALPQGPEAAASDLVEAGIMTREESLEVLEF